mmetsp:Transcript_166579/g.529339  ORF Transcript_166579/g.529339 Transcript_166579/m.529339 type:complete len:520 (+) Transcript_166579:84-1643(+)|eukprot:CAMPEP_0203872050 /NCGR_PEP_ID=MMETSP0359-20131031/19051_1 /ASSEMBLY_ACC=CAM_ASM_000338 /TAXON_ID=268821 /ORGANISM="Scrippsiella Hangoei, Strain SHTV-5" /LENGTH=519 /DNA_ID=CAMNT_0050790735 /DNA_START=64 /DNA_END=1623 /DNA_ORIENTATION=+
MGAVNSGARDAGELDTNTDFDQVRKDIMKVMDSPEWDDGSYAPVLIRLAWHSAGTYSSADGTGGSNGATMRHTLEANDPDNAGLGIPRKLLEAVKEKHPGLSYADLWVLAAYCAIQHTAGPEIDFRGGRRDAAPQKAIAPGRLPNPERGVEEGCMEVDSEGRIKGWEKSAEHIREVFGRMGFGDREMVALICGGHVYGRCHNEHSGYAGAWVENSTRFSNEYAADMFGDRWILVTHDTKMPDGGEVPEEVRPSPGKRQYIDLSKYEGEEEGAKATRKAPDCQEHPAGRYVCESDWVNVREEPDTGSPIIGRFVKDQEINLVAVKVFGTAIRGRSERGGWISIIASGGKVLFERRGDIDTQMMKGSFRPMANVPIFERTQACGGGKGKMPAKDFAVSLVEMGTDEGDKGAVFGKIDNGWALLYSPSRGLLAEKIVEGYNDKPLKAIKGQSGHQMMLITDMVMLWDPAFSKVLQEYADDEQVLRTDFADAFKRLTELGCPWSTDFFRAGAGGGCPVFGCKA